MKVDNNNRDDSAESNADPPLEQAFLAPTPVIHFGILVLSIILAVLIPIQLFSRGVANILGIGIFGSGIIMMRWFFQTMRRNGAPVAYRAEESKLVTDGPFQYSRNPMYLAIVLFHAGLACLVNALGFALVLPVHILVMQYGVIRHEERHLERVFGEQYRTYKTQVHRWIGL
ncbi:methyltransferase family protein [Halocatena halophila]|uniref:methyltransferase family protein n=1 Tax=Halocatena halophila TaxID=2814576 RepID=UPI002ED39897